ncbi:MAG: NADH-quinone oxidoreductase subunit NuoE [Ponticaulis sp.]|nr:NADH-quinone oxidoreductase subunit NuoE [Ponticaulis sp.]|tara:strand:- start:81956 stop:82996 length:1041 start_codon:yes stop_codon:yes gene_type:complete
MAVRRFDLEAGGDTFEFLNETEDKISFWLGKYPETKKRSAVIPLLWLAQKDNGGWLSEPAMREVAERLEMPYIRVYEVATFYTMFRLKPVGKSHVQLCGTTPCMLRGANDLKDVCRSKIGKPFQVNESGRLSWEEVECLGACANAPMVQINDYYYEDLTTDSLAEILDKLENGVAVEPGTFVDRQTSAPQGEAMTLKDPALFDGSVPKGISALPNLPDEKPETQLKSLGDVNPKVVKAKSVKAEAKAADAAVEEGKPLPEDNESRQRPEALSEPEKGEPDHLESISGIGPVLAGKLNSLGIFHFHQIATWGEKEIAWIDDYLSFKGRVERERWIPQAIELAGKAKS